MLPAPTTIAISTPSSEASWTCVGDRLHAVGIGAVLELAHQGLARELQQDSLEDRVRHRRQPYVELPARSTPRRPRSGRSARCGCSRRSSRRARRAAARSSCPRSGRRRTCSCSSRTTSFAHLASCPSTIRSITSSGLPSSRAFCLEDAPLGLARLLGDLVDRDVLRGRARRRGSRPRGRTPGSRRCGRRSRSRTGPRPARRPCLRRGCRRRRRPRWSPAAALRGRGLTLDA